MYMKRLMIIFFLLVFAGSAPAGGNHGNDSEHKNSRGKHRGPSASYLYKKIQELEDKVENIKVMGGPPGPEGPPGPPGQSGISSLAGKSCPAGLAIIGFSNNGELICAAPWNMPPTGEPPDLGFNCIENYNQSLIEAQLLLTLQDIQDPLVTSWLQQFDGLEVGGGSITIDVMVNSVQFVGGASVTAPLIDLTEAEPCADGVRLTVAPPDVVITGRLNISVLGIPISSGFQFTQQQITVDALARLSSPDLNGAVIGDTFERVFSSTSILRFNSGGVDMQVQVADSTIANLIVDLTNTFTSQISNDVTNAISEEILTQFLGLQAPVTIEVVSDL